MHSVKCPEETRKEIYNGETGTRLVEQIDEHGERQEFKCVSTISESESCPCNS